MTKKLKSYQGYRSYPSFLTAIYLNNDYNANMTAVNIIKTSESYHHALKALCRTFEGDHTPYDNNLIRRIHLAEWLGANWVEYHNPEFK